MPPPLPTLLVQHIRGLVDKSDAHPCDRELLRRFAAGNDQEAFATLIRRHAAMVWNVCQRSLPCVQDAEDAFQAAFLVLARRAGSVLWQDSVAGWLHTVAVRVARKARSRAARPLPVQGRKLVVGDALEEITGRELLAALDEEVSSLPEKYRAPLLLCCLEGQPQEETARQLGTSLSTLRRRLERGRRLLHTRLTRRGLSLSAALALPLLGRSSAPAAPLARAIGATRTGVPARVLALANALSRDALRTALKRTAALVLTLGVIAAGAAALRQGDEREAVSPPRLAAAAASAPNDDAGDPLPPGAVRRLGTTRLRHRKTLRSLAYSPDGKWLASGGWDPVLRIWNPVTGKEVRQIAGPDRGVDAVAFSPDGRALAGAGIDGNVYFYGPATGKELRRLKAAVQGLHCVAFSRRGDRVAAGGEGREVRVWDVRSGKALFDLGGHSGSVRALAFSPDGKTLAVGAGDTTTHLWDMATGTEQRKLRGHGGCVNAVAFTPDGKSIVTAADDSNDEAVRVWDVSTGKELTRLRGHRGAVRALAFSADGTVLATGGWDHTIRLWSWPQVTLQRSFRAHADGVATLAFAPDGKALASGCPESAIHLWNTATGSPREVAGGHRERINSVSVAPDGRTIATAAWDGTVRLWHTSTGKERRRLQAVTAREPQQHPLDPEYLRQVLFAPNGRFLAAVRGDEVVVLWDAATGRELYRLRGSSVAFAPDGRTLAVGGRGNDGVEINMGVIRLYATVSGKEVRSFHGHKTAIASITFTPDGKQMISRGIVLEGLRWGERGESETRFVRVWDVATGKELPCFPGNRLGSVALSADGRTLASTADMGATITLWETASRQQRTELAGHKEMVFALAFAPDGRTLASGSMDGTVRLWDLPSGRQIARLEGHCGWVLALAFAPDGKTLVSGSLDTTALVWDVAALRLKRPADSERTLDQLRADWEKLAGAAGPAYAAMSTLVSSPQQSVLFLRQRLQPAASVDARRLEKLIADLDAELFKAREQATAQLEALGELAVPALRKALKGDPSPEARRRLERLLHKLGTDTPDALLLRRVRAVEVLERIGTAEARRTLDELAKGAPEARLTQEARASLDRLAGGAAP